MSIFELSHITNVFGIFGLLQVVSLLGLLLLLFKSAQYYLHRQWLIKSLQQFPPAPPHWLFGNTLKDQDLQQILLRVEKFPSTYVRWLWGNHARVMIYDPDYMKVILGRSDPKVVRSYSFFAPWIGYGLLLLNGKKWFQHRRMLTPAFHYDILKPYVGIMVDSVHVMLDKWEQLVGQDCPLEIYRDISFMTMETMMKCAFSYQERVIRMRKAQLQNEAELEKVRKKKRLDFLDILLFAQERPSGLPSSCDSSIWTSFRNHLDQMPYTTMCIKEALRLYPPIPGASRELSSPVTFPDGRSLPKGFLVTLSFYGLHHNPRLWPNAEKLYRETVRHE